jgi:hypothetical protein
MDTKEDLEFAGREDGRLIEDQWAKLPVQEVYIIIFYIHFNLNFYVLNPAQCNCHRFFLCD